MVDTVHTIHVVDDDANVRDSIVALFASAKLLVRVFPDAATFLEAFDPAVSGCIVLDVRLPGMSGFDLRNELRGRSVEMPIIFMTAYGDIPMAIDAIKNGAVDFIEKPISGQVLLDRVCEAVKRDAALREKRASREEVAARFDRLTPREREVFHLLVRGDSLKQIAYELHRSIKTIEVHTSKVTSKLEVSSRIDLFRTGLKAGLINV